ncbi:MAG: hypothetical protein U9R74_07435 [Pseudomonadota bacterium]|nr:hypothetical protein [Pseudomonadota bacterium]
MSNRDGGRGNGYPARPGMPTGHPGGDADVARVPPPPLMQKKNACAGKAASEQTTTMTNVN